jgi:hypothetical protein
VLTLGRSGAGINNLKGRKEGGVQAPALSGRLGAKYFAPLIYSCFIIVHNALGQEKKLLLILLLFME